MEFCPEVAVLQSAFQLLDNKAGKKLGDLTKECCKDYTNIISTTVREICAGLEHDNEAPDVLLWQQKSHLLIFYALVAEKYQDKQEVKPGCVPILTSLDTLTRPLPTFSAHFYFELVKVCSWEQCFIDILQYLDAKLAVQILQDMTEHCRFSPVTESDTSLITLVLENLLASCLSSHRHGNYGVLKSMAADLNKKKQYKWTVYPDDRGMDSKEIRSRKKDNGYSSAISEPSVAQTSQEDTGPQQSYAIWSLFLQNNSSFILLALDYSSRKHLEIDQDSAIDIDVCQRLGRYLAQLLFLWYLIHVGQGSESRTFDSWFVYNVGAVQADGKVDYDTPTATCALNYQLIDCLSSQLQTEKLCTYIHKCLVVIQKILQTGLESKEIFQTGTEPQKILQTGTEPKESVFMKTHRHVEIVSPMQIRLDVLLRMFHGTVDKVESSPQTLECLKIVEWILSGEENSDRGIEGGVLEDGMLGESWHEDVSLPVLLWRIESCQPQAEACVEMLLTEECRSFWYIERVYNVLEDESARPLLRTTGRVLKLINIAHCIQQDASRETSQRLLNLILTVFSELPFPDQDYIVMVTYKQRPLEAGDIFMADQAFTVNTTNVFNKLTAVRDDQVHRELFQLCLTDPVAVIRQAVEICIRNEEQAVNSAKVLQGLLKTCSCHHRHYHADISLLCLAVHDFVTSVRLTDKEQKHFATFLAHILQVESGAHVLLSPLEFLQTTVLPHTSVAISGDLCDTPISAKFSLNLLMTSLTASCNKRCDWSKSDLEPMAVAVILAQILHECVVLWDGGQGSDEELTSTVDTERSEVESWGLLTLGERAVLREKAGRCLHVLCDMMEKGIFLADDVRVEWLLQETSCLHWSVQYRLLKLIKACGQAQYAADWAVSLQDCIPGDPDQLVSLLMLVSLDDDVAAKITLDTNLDSSDIITALVQVWPHLLQEDCQRVVGFLENQLARGTIPLAYRLSMPSLMPMIGLTSEHGAVLGVSQILRDVVLTLTLHEDGDSTSALQMLIYAVQNYVAAMKAVCESISKPAEAQVFVLSQTFVHVCDVTNHLPGQAAELTWVLLLNSATQFETLCTDGRKMADGVVRQTVERLAGSCRQVMMETVQRLRRCEERDMIMKKLGQ